MHMPDVFLKRATECELMARSALDAQTRAAWKRMADRWNRCAEIAKVSRSPARNRDAAPRRKPAPSWNHQFF